MLEEGKTAPDFVLPDDTGNVIRLSELKGSAVVVYFYPKDDTSGCTKEAQAFSTHLQAFKDAGATIIGISPDSVTSHQKFKAKHDLTITLGADEERKAAEAYGVWVEKSMYGRKYMGIERTTFLIDKTGKLARVWRKVKVPGHVEAVLAAVHDL